jgi:hypothetical protein
VLRGFWQYPGGAGCFGLLLSGCRIAQNCAFALRSLRPLQGALATSGAGLRLTSYYGPNGDLLGTQHGRQGAGFSHGFGGVVARHKRGRVMARRGVAHAFGRVAISTSVLTGHSYKCWEQVYEKKSGIFLGKSRQNFQPNPDRISTESSLLVEPNLDRISESLSLTVEPNPNRILKSVKDFIFLAACSLGVRCRIYELGLTDC